MSRPTDPRHDAPDVTSPVTPDLPVDEQWSEDEEARFDDMLDRLYAGGYFDGHRDQDYWI